MFLGLRERLTASFSPVKPSRVEQVATACETYKEKGFILPTFNCIAGSEETEEAVRCAYDNMYTVAPDVKLEHKYTEHWNTCGQVTMVRGVEADYARRRYVPIKQLGSGTYGSVWKMKIVGSEREIALKMFVATAGGDGVNFPSNTNEEFTTAMGQLATELKIISSVDSPNVIRYCDAFANASTRSVFLEMEFIDGSELGDWAQATTKERRQTKFIPMWRDALLALDALHSNNIAHRDIKGANIMVQRERLIFIDLGLSVHAEADFYDEKYPPHGPVIATHRNNWKNIIDAIVARTDIDKQQMQTLVLAEYDQMKIDIYTWMLADIYAVGTAFLKYLVLGRARNTCVDDFTELLSTLPLEQQEEIANWLVNLDEANTWPLDRIQMAMGAPYDGSPDIVLEKLLRYENYPKSIPLEEAIPLTCPLIQ